MPTAPGDHPESVQFVALNGARTSLPVARRTLIPAEGGAFTTTITSSVGRGVGQISTYNIDVPQGKQDLDVSLPHGGRECRQQVHLLPDRPERHGYFPRVHAHNQQFWRAGGRRHPGPPNPVAGRWEIDVELNLTTSGLEFTQTVDGTLGYDQPPATP